MAAGAPRPRRRAAAARTRTLVSPYTVVGRSTVSLGVASRGVVGPKTAMVLGINTRAPGAAAAASTASGPRALTPMARAGASSPAAA
jgi:hypothetical protein